MQCSLLLYADSGLTVRSRRCCFGGGWNRPATCWRPEVKGLNPQVNSIYNGWRMEDVWLDR
jgi:hypothetical protein